MKLLPDNPTQSDYLHAIRAVAARGDMSAVPKLKEIFDLADAGMMSPPRKAEMRMARRLSDGWNHLSSSLVGMPISDPRWKHAVDWLNANRQYQNPIPRLPNVQAMASADTKH